MLSIFGKKTRPHHEMEAIISATAGYEEKTLRKWQKISTCNSDNIHIIVSGEVEFRRSSDVYATGTMYLWSLRYFLQLYAYAGRGAQ